jgi:hypothetical protein
MNKKQLKSIMKQTEQIRDDSTYVHDIVNSLYSIDLSIYRDKLLKNQAKTSLEEGENEILDMLWKVAYNCQMLIKKIDKESLREFQERDQHKIDCN